MSTWNDGSTVIPYQRIRNKDGNVKEAIRWPIEEINWNMVKKWKLTDCSVKPI